LIGTETKTYFVQIYFCTVWFLLLFFFYFKDFRCISRTFSRIAWDPVILYSEFSTNKVIVNHRYCNLPHLTFSNIYWIKKRCCHVVSRSTVLLVEISQLHAGLALPQSRVMQVKPLFLHCIFFIWVVTFFSLFFGQKTSLNLAWYQIVCVDIPESIYFCQHEENWSIYTKLSFRLKSNKIWLYCFAFLLADFTFQIFKDKFSL